MNVEYEEILLVCIFIITIGSFITLSLFCCYKEEKDTEFVYIAKN